MRCEVLGQSTLFTGVRHVAERPASRRVEASITIDVPEEGVTLADLESAVWSAASAAARDALAAACEVMEADALARVWDGVSLDRRRPLNVLTRFGWVRLMRWYVKDRDDYSYRHPLDTVLSLVPRQHASPWVIQQAAALLAQMPVRQAADLLSRYVGTGTDFRTLHSLRRQSELRLLEVPASAEMAIMKSSPASSARQTARRLPAAVHRLG